MQQFVFSQLTLQTIKSLVSFSQLVQATNWQPAVADLTDEEKTFVAILRNRLQEQTFATMNEATVWSKAIQPLLLMAERQPFRSWAEVALSAEFAQFKLEGIADGVIGAHQAGYPVAPYFVVWEAKREVEAKDPQPQLFGVMLAAAKLNWDENKQEPQTIYGCYTIGDCWTFVEGEIKDITADKPFFQTKVSREYVERFQAEEILGILKAIVAKNEQQ